MPSTPPPNDASVLFDGKSLARLLAEKRGARNLTSLPRLTVEIILE
jgi:hypothetical protein